MRSCMPTRVGSVAAILLLPIAGQLGAAPCRTQVTMPVLAPWATGKVHSLVYSTANGTWASTHGALMPGSDVIYNNTVLSSIFGPMGQGQTWYTAGLVPSPTHPPISVLRPGCATEYLIAGFEFGYCTDQPFVDLELEFYDQFVPCAALHTDPIKALISLPGLPGSPTPGTQVCFVVTVDLRGPAGGQTFWLEADGDGSYTPPYLSLNQFGFGFRVTSPVGANTGPLLGGNGSSNPVGTRWWIPSVDYGQPGTGRASNGNLEVQPLGSCIDMDPLAEAMYLRLFSDACGALAGEPFCTGDGSATPCPCGNSSPPLNHEGCRNSINGVNGGRFEATGLASISGDTVILKALRLPATTSVLFFQGTTRQGGGLGSVFGDGLRCAGGSVMRLGTQLASAGEAAYPGSADPAVAAQGGVASPGTRTYQAWYRNSAAYCTAAVFNLTNGWEIAWQS